MAKGIYKRGDFYWIRYAGLDGRIVYESTKSDKFKDAETLLLERKRDIRQGKQPEKKKIENHTFKELAEKYLPWIHGRQKSERVKGYINRQAPQHIWQYPLAEILHRLCRAIPDRPFEQRLEELHYQQGDVCHQAHVYQGG